MEKYKQHKIFDQLECEAIEDAFLMPAVSTKDLFDRRMEMGNVAFFVDNSVRFETDQWVD